MTDVYKVGVSLVMTGNFAQVLGVLSSKLLGINKQVKELEGGFSKLKVAIVGALGAYTGTKILETMGTMVKYGDKLVHQQNLLAAAGATQKEVAEATAKAYETSARVQTTTVSENIQHLKELRYAFGDMDKAQSSLEIVSKAQTVMKAATGHGYGDQIWDIVKSLEMTNKTLDPETFARYVDMMTQVVTATGGKVTPQQYFQAFKYGRTASQGWDAGFIGGALPRLIQSMGGGTGGGGGRAGPGNALMSAYQEIVQGQIPKKAQELWKSFGLTGAAINPNLFSANPYEWVQQVLGPALAAKGVIMPNMSEDDIKKLYSTDESFETTKQRSDALGMISRLLPNRTSSQAIAEMLLQGRFLMGENSQFEKDIRLQKGAMGIGAFDFLMDKDLQTNMQAFTAQWHSLLESLGSTLVPTAISVLKTFTGLFTDLTKFSSLHPDAIREIGKAIGALAVGLGVISAVALVAALGPLVGVGGLIAGVATALGILAASHWSEIKSGLEGVADSLKSFWDRLKGVFQNGLPNGMMPGGASYTGGAYYQPASYTTYGSSSDGVASTPSGGGVASNPGSGVGRALGTPANVGASPMGNLPITGRVDRSRFLAELNAKPWLINKMATMVAGEVGGQSPEFNKLTVLSEAFNRAQARGTSLEQALLSVSESRLGYYAGLGAPGGGTYGPSARAWARSHLDYFKSNILGPVLGGWDEASRRAGFEITGNASGSVAAHQIARGTPHVKIGNEWYLAEGPFKHPIPHLADRPPDMYGTGPHNPAYSAWQWGHNFRSDHSAIPSPQSGEVHVHNTTLLDGRVIAHSTMKHIVAHGNRPATGGRLSDISLTRPMTV